jgi:hypothetical protein
MVGATFTVAAAAEVLRSKKGITAVGNAQVSTAQSKFGGASLLLDGTDDRLTITPTGSFAYPADFTVEGWGRITSLTVTVFFSQGTPNGADMIALYVDDVGVVFYYANGGGRITGGSLSVNTWYHFAVSRSGSSTKLFVNGTQVGSTYTDSTTIIDGTFNIGTWTDASSGWNGYIDEVRVSNSARYTTTFTPSTIPFVNDANTLLLIHANGTNASTFFEDDNGVRAPKGISAIGNAQVDTAQSKFGGASALFDGTGDYLQIPNSSDFNFGSSAFTIEGWVRAANFTGSPSIMGNAEIGTYNGWNLQFGGNGQLYIEFVSSGGASMTLHPTSAFSANTWGHFAFVRSGNSLYIFKDGTLDNTVSVTWAFNNSPSPLIIGKGFGIAGGFSENSTALAGHLDEVRISNSARYTTTFTPSTTPFVNDTNTSVLIHADGTDASTVFRDDNGARAQSAISSVNGANISSTQSYFGATSASFASASSQYALLAKGVDLTDLTVEFWYRATTLPGSGLVPLISFNNTLMYIGYAGGTCYDFFNGGSKIALNPVTINTGTWYNVAFVRSGGNITVYHNGTSVATGSSWSTAVNWGSYDVEIGKYSSYYLNGFIDELRISNTARYTGNYSVATAPFQNDSNTLLLMHMDGTNGSTVFTDDNGIAPYTP